MLYLRTVKTRDSHGVSCIVFFTELDCEFRFCVLPVFKLIASCSLKDSELPKLKAALDVSQHVVLQSFYTHI